MNIRKTTILSIVLFVFSITVIFMVFRDTTVKKIDAVTVNDITQSLAEQWENLGIMSKTELPCLQYHLDYVVIDHAGQLIAETRNGLNETIHSAISNRDTIVDITHDGMVLGKLILYNNTYDLWETYRNRLIFLAVAVVTLIVLFCILNAVYIDRIIFRPFRKLQFFAKNVAEGKLDIPLKMDKGNLFGAFTESFDLMREELAKARESERLANQSKKELVASLSHDIKTPVASIKAVTEVMMVKSKDENDIKQLKIINTKADQINTLITNMFNATLEELQQLSVRIGEYPGSILYELIRNADYNGKAVVDKIPDCLIRADKLRLQQVIDNIFANSYKYADTSIMVSAGFCGPYLELAIRDYGPGVLPDELPLLFNKFYRAKNAEDKNGAGLGLYISNYLMTKMAGEIGCANLEHGFAIKIKLRLA